MIDTGNPHRHFRRTEILKPSKKVANALGNVCEKFTYALRIDGVLVTAVLEQEFWQALKNIASKESTDIEELFVHIFRSKGREISFGTALRVFALQYFITST